MCGIFSIINNNRLFDDAFIRAQFEKGQKRGPEFSTIEKFGYDIQLGFHRLAINGLNEVSNQPIVIDNIILVCNGEIYNYKELFQELKIEPVTGSDCEIIIHLYLLYGIEQTLQLLDGVFSFILYDMRIVENEPLKIFVARDPIGVRPLYILRPNQDTAVPLICIASELKVLSGFYSEEYTIEQFTPGTYSVFEKSYKILSKWREIVQNKNYFILLNTIYHNVSQVDDEIDWIICGIQKYLIHSVKKRYLNTERPIACLLSGGLDSSLITALVCELHSQNASNQVPIETYSIGLKNSEDLKYAKIVADYLGTNHTEIIVTEEEMLSVIPEVIYAIESYDTTTIRASIGNYLLGKYISQNSEAKVIFNGDGSDELCGGYLYMGHAPTSMEFDIETRRLLKDIHMFDVLRSDKCISSHGLEPRTPFLDKSFVQFYLSIPSHLRTPSKWNNCEKFFLRLSFSHQYFMTSQNRQILPNEILRRRKEAFSDGVSIQGRSLYQIIQEYVEGQNTETTHITYLPPTTNEQKYYRTLYDSFYPNLEKLVPYFWMPKYVDATDPSARTLELYKQPVLDHMRPEEEILSEV